MREKPTDRKLMAKLEYLASSVNLPLDETNPGMCCVVWGIINMFGFGETPECAMKDLLDCLKEYYKELTTVGDELLGPIPSRDAEILNKFFNW